MTLGCPLKCPSLIFVHSCSSLLFLFVVKTTKKMLRPLFNGLYPELFEWKYFALQEDENSME